MSYTLLEVLLHSLNPSTCLPLILLNFLLHPQFHHQNPNLFICCLLCLKNIWGHFGFALGDIWLPDSQLQENPLPCWIRLLIWDPSLGVLLETRLACVGKLHPVFLAGSRCRAAEDNSKCALGFVLGALSSEHRVVGWLWGDVHKAGGGRRLQPQAPSQLCLYIHVFTKKSLICV